MVETGSTNGFSFESCSETGVGRKVRVQDLCGDGTTEDGVGRFPDFGHAATGQGPDEFVALSEAFPGDSDGRCSMWGAPGHSVSFARL